MVCLRRIVSEQLGQRASPRLMHSGSQRAFDRFQVESAVIVALLKNQTQKPVYFAGDFLLDGFGRFSSWAEGRVSSTGRNWQICSLTSNS